MKKFLKLVRRIILLFLLIIFIWLISPIKIDVPYISQYPSLPNGCEVISLEMVLRYYGYNVTGQSLSQLYLPKGSVGVTDPREKYAGDPESEDGYYCYQKPLVVAANHFLRDQKSSYHAYAPKFLGWFRLSWHIHRDEPVICWVTIDGNMPRKKNDVIWHVSGKEMKPYSNLHVVVVNGIKWWNIQLQDPIGGQKEVPITEFLKMYFGMGMRSIVISNA